MLDTITDEKIEWIQIECRDDYTIGLTKDGDVFSWGLNNYGQLGHGDADRRSALPEKVASLDGLAIISISCGCYHTAAITDRGEILTWYVQS